MLHNFEDVEIKINASILLEQKLKTKRKKGMIFTGAMSDPYLNIPESLANTRRCFELIHKYGFGLSVLTKSDLILQDIDLLMKINKMKCVVQTTLTTFDEALCKIIEPNVASTKQRVAMLKVMQTSGIKTVVWLSPILPFINDTKENIQGLLDYCIDAGVYGILCFGMGLTLREGNREYFYKQLDRHFVGLKEKYMQIYRNDYVVNSPNSKELMNLFANTCNANGIKCSTAEVFNFIETLDAITATSLFDC